MGIIKKYKQWSQKRAKAIGTDNYIRGYNLTAGSLLKGITLEEIESNIECNRDFGCYTKFDKGCEDAIDKLEEIGFKFNRAD